jgi:hypothetical protein
LKDRKRDNHFSGEVWNDTASRYSVPIQNLSQESWDLIVDGAWKVSQKRKASHVASTSVDLDMPEADERELLAEGDEVVEDDVIVWECESL